MACIDPKEDEKEVEDGEKEEGEKKDQQPEIKLRGYYSDVLGEEAAEILGVGPDAWSIRHRTEGFHSMSMLNAIHIHTLIKLTMV